MSGWIGVDFDGTLATYGHWAGATHVGEPVKPMVERVKKWLADGQEVRIFTARVWPYAVVRPDMSADIVHNGAPRARLEESLASAEAIQAWCEEHLGAILTVTCVKDYGMVELYDDRAVQVRMNTGELVGQSTRGR